jgi:hypothetical protein
MATKNPIRPYKAPKPEFPSKVKNLPIPDPTKRKAP